MEVNSQFIEMIGAKDKLEVIGTSILDYIQPSSMDRVKTNLKKEKTDIQEYSVKKQNGELLTILAHGKNIEINGKKVRLSTMIDISEIKEKDRLLYQQSKMASMGEMMGNIAHQWRQPLAIISMISNNMRADIELESVDENIFKNYTIEINRQTQQLSSTIDDFRNFFKKDKNRSEVYLSDTIKKSLKLIKLAFDNSDIKIVTNIDSSIKIVTYENELIQAIINILNNAKDILKLSNKKRLVFIEIKEIDQEVIIEIQDSGGGVKEEIIDKIFEPYFTTKHQSKGTGIGLYMTKQIIEKNIGGKIEVKNEICEYEGEEFLGAKFIIRLTIKEKNDG